MIKRNKKYHMVLAQGERNDGLRIAQYRISIGMSQEELADLRGVTQQTVSNWEQTLCIDDPLFSEIANDMGITPEKLRRFNPPMGTHYHIQEIKDSACFQSNNQTAVNNVNPLDELKKAQEENKALYERLVETEREKNTALLSVIEMQKEAIALLKETNQQLQKLLDSNENR